MSRLCLVITCEHAGHHIPAAFAYLFRQAKKDLESHRGWDPGALTVAQRLAAHFSADFFYYEYSRLLIEVNRSVGHPWLYSEYTRGLSESVKKYLLSTYYKPYRRKVEQEVRRHVESGQKVLHLSVHTFTPVWEEKMREVEVGLLYDEERKAEVAFCTAWSTQLAQRAPTLTIRHNEPYRGADDGFTTYLRGVFLAQDYLGIELEVSQKWVGGDLDRIAGILTESLSDLV